MKTTIAAVGLMVLSSLAVSATGIPNQGQKGASATPQTLHEQNSFFGVLWGSWVKSGDLSLLQLR